MAAILNFANTKYCSMMTKCHQSDLSSVCSPLPKTRINNTTLYVGPTPKPTSASCHQTTGKCQNCKQISNTFNIYIHVYGSDNNNCKHNNATNGYNLLCGYLFQGGDGTDSASVLHGVMLWTALMSLLATILK